MTSGLRGLSRSPPATQCQPAWIFLSHSSTGGCQGHCPASHGRLVRALLQPSGTCRRELVHCPQWSPHTAWRRVGTFWPQRPLFPVQAANLTHSPAGRSPARPVRSQERQRCAVGQLAEKHSGGGGIKGHRVPRRDALWADLEEQGAAGDTDGGAAGDGSRSTFPQRWSWSKAGRARSRDLEWRRTQRPLGRSSRLLVQEELHGTCSEEGRESQPTVSEQVASLWLPYTRVGSGELQTPGPPWRKASHAEPTPPSKPGLPVVPLCMADTGAFRQC